MFAKVKPQVFLDSLTMEPNGETNVLKAVLKDEGGRICRSFEDDNCKRPFSWRDLSDLPYGIYTLELSNGCDEMKMKLVKRI